MPAIALLLGPVVFQDFEVPEAVHFGGIQRLAVHRLPGGARVVDAMGREETDIVFSGTFSGAEATSRARLLDALRGAGLPLPLSWDGFTYTVVIRAFEARYERPGWVPFRIVCAVLRDEAAALLQAPFDLAGAALGDLGLASGFIAGATAAASALALADAALRAPGASTREAPAHTAATAALAAAEAALGAELATAEAALDADALGEARADAAALGQLAALALARAHAGRAGRVLAEMPD